MRNDKHQTNQAAPLPLSRFCPTALLDTNNTNNSSFGFRRRRRRRVEIRDVNSLRQKSVASSPSPALGSNSVLSGGSRELISDNRDSSSVSSPTSLDRFAADYSGELPTSDLFSPPDVDDTFLMATGHDAGMQRNDTAVETGSACRALSANAACRARGGEETSSFLYNEPNESAPSIEMTWG